jgi:dimeric dUTPase (all-alpha-NTP-PPase superfamily)
LAILIENGILDVKIILDFCKNVFSEQPLPLKLEVGEQNSYMQVLMFFSKQLKLDGNVIMKSFLEHIYFANHVEEFRMFKDIFPNDYNNFTNHDDFFKQKLQRVVDLEFSEANEENFADVISDLEKLSEDFGIDVSTEVRELQKKNDEYEGYIDSRVENMDFDYKSAISEQDFNSENDKIDDLFQSLK